jgi:hypothetical protein
MGSIRFESSYPRYNPSDQPRLIGFDADGPYQMVPYRGYRHLHLSVVGVNGWSVESENSSIAGISDRDRNNVFKVNGLSPGRTFLTAKGPKREEVARIEIEVKLERKPFIRFFLVSDNAGHKTTFTEKDTKSWTEFINEKVFGPQINVRFQYLSTTQIRINENLGDRINLANLGLMPYVKRDDKREAAVIWHKITDAGMLHPNVFNVFCVWDFEAKSEAGQDAAAFVHSKVRVTLEQAEKLGANNNMCILKENTIAHGLVLAHEAGHYLKGDHTEADGQLMNPGGAGLFLPKADAKTMNPT